MWIKIRVNKRHFGNSGFMKLGILEFFTASVLRTARTSVVFSGRYSLQSLCEHGDPFASSTSLRGHRCCQWNQVGPGRLCDRVLDIPSGVGFFVTMYNVHTAYFLALSFFHVFMLIWRHQLITRMLRLRQMNARLRHARYHNTWRRIRRAEIPKFSSQETRVCSAALWESPTYTNIKLYTVIICSFGIGVPYQIVFPIQVSSMNVPYST